MWAGNLLLNPAFVDPCSLFLLAPFFDVDCLFSLGSRLQNATSGEEENYNADMDGEGNYNSVQNITIVLIATYMLTEVG